MFNAGLILGISVIFKLVCGLVLLKVFAVQLSVAEFGIAGQFMTVISILTTIAGGAQTHGLIKLLSQHADDVSYRTSILRSAHLVAYVFAAVVIVIIGLLATPLSGWIFDDSTLAPLFTGILFAFFFAGLNNIQIAALSASRKLVALSVSQSAGILLGTVIAIAGAVYFGLAGAVTGFAFIGVSNFLCSFVATRRSNVITLQEMLPLRDVAIIRKLVSYSVSLIAAIYMMPVAHIVGRVELAGALGWQQVGYWQAVLRVSDVVTQLFGTFFNNYLLAVYSGMANEYQRFRLLLKLVPGIFVLTAFGFVCIYVLRDVYILIFLTPEYAQIGTMMPYQFVGDVLRITAAIGSIIFLSRQKLFAYVGFEVLAACTFVLSIRLLIPEVAELAPVIAHLITYGTVFLAMGLTALRGYLVARKSADWHAIQR